MNRLPMVACTTIVRSAHRSQNHGGVFLVDLETQKIEQVVDWSDQSIDWAGAGGDRDLRGMATYKGELWIAASKEIHVFNEKFEIVRSFTNKFLKGIHEIFRHEETLLLASTATDCIVEFDLKNEQFGDVHWLSRQGGDNDDTRIQYKIIDPSDELPEGIGDSIHINNVCVHGGYILAGALKVGAILVLKDGQIFPFGKIPVGTHNVQPFQGGLFYHLSEKGELHFTEVSGEPKVSFETVRYPEDELVNIDLSNEFAHQGFARGICVIDEETVVTGSSPATISVYSLAERKCLKSINISADIRQALHSIVIWPPA